MSDIEEESVISDNSDNSDNSDTSTESSPSEEEVESPYYQSTSTQSKAKKPLQEEKFKKHYHDSLLYLSTLKDKHNKAVQQLNTLMAHYEQTGDPVLSTKIQGVVGKIKQFRKAYDEVHAMLGGYVDV